jgi:hypothetical protein
MPSLRVAAQRRDDTMATPDGFSVDTKAAHFFRTHGRIQQWIKEWHKSSERASDGSHVTIEVSTNITSLGSVSTVDKSFISDFFVILHWKVPQSSAAEIMQMEQDCKSLGPQGLAAFWAKHENLAPSLEIENAKDVTQIVPDIEERKFPRIDKVSNLRV